MVVTVNLQEFAPMVQVYAPTAPWPTVTANLRRAAIEFCERTRCWRQPTTVTMSGQDEVIVAPQYAAIHKIEYATFEGNTDLKPIHFVDARHWQGDGQPRFITQANPNTVRVIPYMDGELDLSVYLKPVEGQSITAPAGGYPLDEYDVVPKFLYTNHAETIAAGALMRLLIIPNQDFTNYDLAPFFAARFDKAANEDFGKNLIGQQGAAVRTKAHFL